MENEYRIGNRVTYIGDGDEGAFLGIVGTVVNMEAIWPKFHEPYISVTVDYPEGTKTVHGMIVSQMAAERCFELADEIGAGMEREKETRTIRVVERVEILPRIRTIIVSWLCLECGGPRGEPFGHNFYEDGESHYCHRWVNPCGHVEMYPSVIEAHDQEHEDA